MAFNILLVDDSDTVRAVMKKMLNIAGVPISTLSEASNGKEALEVLKQQWVDIVFADINMPVMDGVEMINKINKDESLKDLSIVVISTEGSTTRINELKDMGIKAYLRKPFTPEQLNTIITDLLGEFNEQKL